ncbi:glycosyl transferase [Pseudoalteromonas sp. R86517]|uniref:glycosyl transferase n=1 Tax=Pseudoalteromonas sp. R86517 TaxID=3093857 RepID=UPI00366C5C40
MFSLIKKIRKVFTIINELERTINTQYKIGRYTEKSLNSKQSLVSDKSDFLVSFTTYSKRIHSVHLMIESLGEQTIKANKLILWLDEDEFNPNNIPEVLKLQSKRGLEIKYCKNYRSYKKLIPTLLDNTSTNIVTVDDDILYPSDMLELLVKESKDYPNLVIAHRVHKIKSNNSEIMSYLDWEHDFQSSEPSEKIFPVGVGGVFYPKGCFDNECLNVSAFMKLAPDADDVWFKIMSHRNGFKSKKVHDTRAFWERFLVIPDGQDIALCVENVDNGGNDKQIKNVLKEYEIRFMGDSFD